MTRTFLIGTFDNEDKFLSSIKSLQENDILIFEVFTPYPVTEIFHLLKRKSNLPTVAYFFGLFGIISTLAFLYFTSVINWPISYGGKPFNSFPSFIVITIVLTILTVTIASLAVFSSRSKLSPGRDNTIFDHRATDDRFVIVVDTHDTEASAAESAGNIMKDKGAVDVIYKDYKSVKA